ncbi:MAG: hypothetical protein SO132_02175 [Candidatus Enteromonas sp.]|nr:hypothetical protein [Candidatus Enteromonas sp.]
MFKKILRFAKTHKFLDYIYIIAMSIILVFSSGHASITIPNSNISVYLLVVGVVITFVYFIFKSNISPILSLKQNWKEFFIWHNLILILFFFLFAGACFYFAFSNDFLTITHYALLFILSLMICYLFTFKKLIKIFIVVVSIICSYSLLLYFCNFLFYEPVHTSSFISTKGISYYNFAYIYFIITTLPTRNCGPFWEPGVFATFITVAILCDCLFSKKINIFRIVLFSITLFTTFSTAGILIFIFAIPLILFVKNKKRISLCLLFFIVVFSIFLPLLSPIISDLPIIGSIFGKFTSHNISLSTRILSPIYGLNIFIKSYGLGYGPNVFDKIYLTYIENNANCESQTSTLGWMAGSFGFVGLLLFLLYFVFLIVVLLKRKNLFVAIYVAVLSLLILNKENQSAFSLFWIFMFYPFFDYLNVFVINKKYSLLDLIYNSSENTQRITWNIFGTLFLKIIAMFVGLFTLPFYISYFGNDYILGVWSSLISILLWILNFDLGIGNGLKNEVIESMASNDNIRIKKAISSSYLSNGIITLFLLLIGIPTIFLIDFNSLLNVSSEILPPIYIKIAFLLAFFSVALELFFKIVLNLFQSLQKQPLASFLTLIPTILLMIFVAIIRIDDKKNALLVLAGFYVLAVNLPLIIATIFVFCTYFKNARPSIKFFDKNIAKKVMSLGGAFFAIQLSLLLINSTDQVLISNIFGSDVVVEYQKYYKIFAAITAIASAISMPVWSLSVKAKAEKKLLWLKKLQKVIVILPFAFFALAFVGVGLLQPFFNFWLKTETIKVNYIYAFSFAIWTFASCASMLSSGLGNGLKIIKPQMAVLLVGAISKIPIIYILNYIYNINQEGWFIIIIIDSIILIAHYVVASCFSHKELIKLFRENTR